ncbi:sugar ABC transporter permease [Microbacterium sp. BK668]|uniref:carbohydrate ABC transporter permease n=1 Tax=Microbacterium sp. BK668 TaxID=2512118 RepID=UPI001AADF197|nr:sugar ABC transporter permease [Microbacterium sp. BK668]
MLDSPKVDEPKVQGRRITRRPGRSGYLFVAFYSVLLLVFGVLPAGYALYLSFTNALGQFVGLGQFVKVFRDFRFGPAFANIAVYVVIWVAVLLVMTVGLALLLRQRARSASSILRFLFYVPGALVGVASILVWMFMLDPAVSPASWVLSVFGLNDLSAVVAPQNLPIIFVIMAFWTGAGGWIVIMYGALNNIPDEVMDAARMDGASALKTAVFVQIPMIKQWIAYMAILAFAGGTQLFAEPQIFGTATGAVDPAWSPNQLAFLYAFQNNDFNGAAAISMFLLLVALAGAVVIITRTGVYNLKDDE